MGFTHIVIRDDTRKALAAMRTKAREHQEGVPALSLSDVIDTLLDIVEHIDGLPEAEVLEAIAITGEREN